MALESKCRVDLDTLLEIHRKSLQQLMVCLSRSWGGLEQVAAQDSIDLGSLGLKVNLLCLEGSPIHEHLASRTEVNLIPLNYHPRNYFDFKLKKIFEDSDNNSVLSTSCSIFSPLFKTLEIVR